MSSSASLQAVDPSFGSAPAALLQGPAAGLAAWYADPLSQREAGELYGMARVRRQACLRQGQSCFRLELLQLVCRYWLEANPALAYRQLASVAREDVAHAQLELVYGQLLISRKLRAAHRHLERGFTLAAGWLESTDYFVLLRRHERLGWLALGDSPAPPASLEMLLNESAVIAQLSGGRRRFHYHSHHDTVG